MPENDQFMYTPLQSPAFYCTLYLRPTISAAGQSGAYCVGQSKRKRKDRRLPREAESLFVNAYETTGF